MLWIKTEDGWVRFNDSMSHTLPEHLKSCVHFERSGKTKTDCDREDEETLAILANCSTQEPKQRFEVSNYQFL